MPLRHLEKRCKITKKQAYHNIFSVKNVFPLKINNVYQVNFSNILLPLHELFLIEMDKQAYIVLFHQMHPGFFEQPDIRAIPEDRVFDEMILRLDTFNEHLYEKKLDGNVSFNYYRGDFDTLKEIVASIIPEWIPLYEHNRRVYCGYVGDKIACCCIIENWGTFEIDGQAIRIGGPGCVVTLPPYRNQGIGLTTISKVTQILKEEGYDYSYGHHTFFPHWCEKLGYRTILRWNKNGIINEPE